MMIVGNDDKNTNVILKQHSNRAIKKKFKIRSEKIKVIQNNIYGFFIKKTK